MNWRFSVLGILLALAALPAQATFPGKNGRIAFNQGPDIFTMNPDGSDVKQLTALSDDNSALFENWSPDGKRLVFSEFPAPDFFGQLWTMNADGSNQQLLLNDPGFDDESPSFSPDGNQIMFTRCAPLGGEFPCAIYRIQVDGSGLTQLTPVRIELQDFEPELSPDGGTVAFESFGRDGVLGAVYLMNPDGSNIRRISDPEPGGFAPDWSPSGREIVFTTRCCNPQLSNLIVMKPDGQNARQITQDNQITASRRGAWSPQGDAIVFRSVNTETGENGIYIMNSDGGGKKLLLKVRPSTFAKHRSSATRPTRPFKINKKGITSTQIEDGGFQPRWGTAQ